MCAMWKLLTGNGTTASRTALIPHAVSATFLLFAGLLVVGLAQMGGGASSSPSPRTLVSGCSSSTSNYTTFTVVGNKLGYYTPSTATVWRTKTVTKTISRTRTVTRTVTYYRTRTKTVCQNTTVTQPGSTSTEYQTTTETATETADPSTVTVTKTLTGTGAGTGFTCPAVDKSGFALGVTDYTVDPIFCSYPVVEGED